MSSVGQVTNESRWFHGGGVLSQLLVYTLMILQLAHLGMVQNPSKLHRHWKPSAYAHIPVGNYSHPTHNRKYGRTDNTKTNDQTELQEKQI